MTTNIPLRCQCGAVRGMASDVSPQTGRRVVCMCDDCQAFARFLGRDDVLDAHGGTDIFQTTPSRIALTEGAEKLAAVRLSPKGMVRFYTSCCRTPVANTLDSAQLPFAGVVHSFMDHASHGRSRNEVLGPPIARIHARDAIGTPPEGAHPKVPPSFIPRVVAWMARNRLAGRHRPSPFYDARTSRPVAEPRVLSAAERDRLRA